MRHVRIYKIAICDLLGAQCDEAADYNEPMNLKCGDCSLYIDAIKREKGAVA